MQSLGSLMAASSEPTRQQLQLMQAVAAATGGQVPRPGTKGATAGSLSKSPYLSHMTAAGGKKEGAPTALPWNGTRRAGAFLPRLSFACLFDVAAVSFFELLFISFSCPYVLCGRSQAGPEAATVGRCSAIHVTSPP